MQVDILYEYRAFEEAGNQSHHTVCLSEPRSESRLGYTSSENRLAYKRLGLPNSNSVRTILLT